MGLERHALERQFGRKSKNLRARKRARAHLERTDRALQRALGRGVRGKKSTQRRPGPDRRSGSQCAAQARRKARCDCAQVHPRERSQQTRDRAESSTRQGGPASGPAPSTRGRRFGPCGRPSRTSRTGRTSPFGRIGRFGRTGRVGRAAGCNPAEAGPARGGSDPAAPAGALRPDLDRQAAVAASTDYRSLGIAGAANWFAWPPRGRPPAWRGDARPGRQGSTTGPDRGSSPGRPAPAPSGRKRPIPRDDPGYATGTRPAWSVAWRDARAFNG